MNEKNKFIRWVTRNTVNNNSLIALLKFISFCLSSVIGLLMLDFNKSNISNTLFLFAIPIAFSLGIETVQAFKTSNKGLPLSITLTLLLLVYAFLSFLAIAGLFSKVDFVSKLLENRHILSPLILSYAGFYVIEMILLFIKDLFNKHKRDKNELKVVDE